MHWYTEPKIDDDYFLFFTYPKWADELWPVERWSEVPVQLHLTTPKHNDGMWTFERSRPSYDWGNADRQISGENDYVNCDTKCYIGPETPNLPFETCVHVHMILVCGYMPTSDYREPVPTLWIRCGKRDFPASSGESCAEMMKRRYPDEVYEEEQDWILPFEDEDDEEDEDTWVTLVYKMISRFYMSCFPD
jgi:hypothetical protein